MMSSDDTVQLAWYPNLELRPALPLPVFTQHLAAAATLPLPPTPAASAASASTSSAPPPPTPAAAFQLGAARAAVSKRAVVAKARAGAHAPPAKTISAKKLIALSRAKGVAASKPMAKGVAVSGGHSSHAPSLLVAADRSIRRQLRDATEKRLRTRLAPAARSLSSQVKRRKKEEAAPAVIDLTEQNAPGMARPADPSMARPADPGMARPADPGMARPADPSMARLVEPAMPAIEDMARSSSVVGPNSSEKVTRFRRGMLGTTGLAALRSMAEGAGPRATLTARVGKSPGAKSSDERAEQ